MKCFPHSPYQNINKILPYQNININSIMQSKKNIPLNGSLHQNNFIWGGAMNLAWNQFIKQIVHQKIELKTESQIVKSMVFNFNESLFTTNSLAPSSYYVKCGYGQKTLNLINQQSKKKFPNKSFADLNYKLNDTDIISYAYLFKCISFLVPFQKHTNFYFLNKSVKGFKVKTADQRKNVLVGAYESEDEFTIMFKLKEEKQQLIIVKGKENLQAHQIINQINKTTKFEQIGQKEKFEMPIVDLSVQRQYKQLINIPFKNQKVSNYHIAVMLQRIKFRLDEEGAKVENEAVMIMKLKAALHMGRSYILNKPFWIIMREKNQHPYFVCHITNTKFMTENH